METKYKAGDLLPNGEIYLCRLDDEIFTIRQRDNEQEISDILTEICKTVPFTVSYVETQKWAKLLQKYTQSIRQSERDKVKELVEALTEIAMRNHKNNGTGLVITKQIALDALTKFNSADQGE